MHRIKSGILAGTALGLLTGLAQAADLPVKAPVYKAPIVSYDPWTGVYVGGNIGYSWGRANTSVTTGSFDYFGATVGGSNVASLKPDGLIAGGQIGYNFWISQDWLAGLEADFQWSGEKNSRRSVVEEIVDCSGPCLYRNTSDITAKLSWFGTVRGRFGVILNQYLYLYATGGLAYGKVSVSGANTLSFDFNVPPDTFTTTFNYSKTKVGYVWGGGLEGRFGKGPWSWKVEYIHIDLGSIGGGSFGSDPLVAVWTPKFTDDIVRFGINFLLWGKDGPT